ncbi:hypothetical protein GCM10018779_31950 [Streptomyces griseocarneus]|nr:hypothetical protein GCM10018779_31950 [Streptomyces griseocarneus]
MEEAGLRLHPDKTKLVHRKDTRRRGSAEHTSFEQPGLASGRTTAGDSWARGFEVVGATQAPAPAGLMLLPPEQRGQVQHEQGITHRPTPAAGQSGSACEVGVLGSVPVPEPRMTGVAA